MDKDILDMSKRKFDDMYGIERDKDGFMLLKPTSSKVDKDHAVASTNISKLEEQLKAYQKEKSKTEKYMKTDDYKESKKKDKKKKTEKAKQSLLEMIFNNADKDAEEASKADIIEDDDDDTSSSPKKKTRERKTTTRLDTTYGKRYTPVVSMLNDICFDFDRIATELQDDLDGNRNAKSVYRASQYGNLITVKNSKLSAIKELASIAKTVSDLEYKKDKDQGAQETDSNKAISALGAKYLKGALDDDVGRRKSGRKKDKDKGGGKPLNRPTARNYTMEDADEEDAEDSDETFISEVKRDNQTMALELTKMIREKKSKIQMTPYERAIAIEGKYKFVVVADSLDLDDWKFVAVDPKTEKVLEDFKDDYKDLYPKRKNCKLIFDTAKMKVVNKMTNQSYKLIFK